MTSGAASSTRPSSPLFPTAPSPTTRSHSCASTAGSGPRPHAPSHPAVTLSWRRSENSRPTYARRCRMGTSSSSLESTRPMRSKRASSSTRTPAASGPWSLHQFRRGGLPKMAGAEVQRRNGHDRRLGFSDVLRAIGPGVITGGADNDPAGIATYSVVGATVGYSQNWLLLLSTPMLIVVQQISAKVANVTKTDLATLLRTTYGARIATPAVLLMVIANVITMGADLLAMAAALQLLTGIKFEFWVVPLAAAMAYLTIFTDYKVLSKYLLWLVAVFATYILAAFLARPNWGDVLRNTLIPHLTLTPAYLLGAVALLGTTITPYLFFWQASGEVEERRGVQGMALRNIDITAGMVWSNLTAFFIIVAAGAVLFTHHAEIRTAADAARALEPFAGRYATVLFAVGIIGAGLLAIPVLGASAAFGVAGLPAWPPGLASHAAN